MGSISPSVVTKNADDKSAIRVVVTNPSPEDAPGPSNLQLSNNEVTEGLPSGTLVGSLTVDGGTAPLVFSIVQDLSNAFQISGNQLQTSRALDFDTEPILNVSVRCTDDNGKFVDQTFSIDVLEAGGFQNRFSYHFTGNGYLLFDTTAMNLALNHSWSFWYKAAQTSSTQYLIGSRNGASSSSGLDVSLFNNVDTKDLRVNFVTTDGREKDYRYNFPAGYNENQWHFVNVVRENTSLSLYLDGVLQIPTATPVDTNITNKNANNTEVYFGANADGTADYLNGFIDEISYHEITLSGTQILNMYNNRVATDLDSTLGVNDFRNWYRADGDSLPAIDDNKGGIDGTSINVSLVGMAPVAYQKTIATDFDLTNYYIGTGIPDFTQAKSFEFWIRRDAAGNEIIYGNRAALGTDNAWSFYGDANANNRIYWEYEGTGSIANRCYWELGAATFGVYVHFVVTMPANLGGFDVNNLNAYLNSGLATRVNSDNDLVALPSTQNSFAIGAGTTGGTPFSGRIAQMTIWDRELTQLEVVELFNGGTPSDPNSVSFASDLFQHFDMGETNMGAVMTDNTNGTQAIMVNFDSGKYVSFP
jgi:hypothetical protein